MKRKSKPTAPVTQSSNREVEKQRREMQQLVKANNKARCEELQLSCELHFNRFASQLGSVLSRDEFDRWIQSYLAGQNDPDVVAKRTDMIEAMINEQVSVATAASKKGKAQFENIQELAEHFAQQRQEIQNLPYEDDMKDSILTVLNGQEDVAIESFFRNGGQ